MLVDCLEDTPIHRREYLITMDVVSLYPSIKLDFLFEQLNQRCSNGAFLIDLIRLITTNNYVQYGQDIFLQTEGIAMGSACSVELANIYMLAADDMIAPHCTQYYRYLDDIFAIVHHNKLAFIHSLLEHTIPGITLTLEKHYQQIPFLDLWIYRKSSRIAFRPYSKPLSLHAYLPAHSQHPPHTLKGYLKGEAIRFVRQSSSRKDFQDRLILFDTHLRRRGYSPALRSLLQFTVSYGDRAFFRRLAGVPSDDTSVVPIILPYFRHSIFDKVKALIRRLNTSEAFTDNWLRALIAYTKSPSVGQLCTRSNLTDLQLQVLAFYPVLL